MTAWTSKDCSWFFFFCCCVFCFVFNYIKYKLRILLKKYLAFLKNLIVLYYALCAGQSCCPIIPPVL